METRGIYHVHVGFHLNSKTFASDFYRDSPTGCKALPAKDLGTFLETGTAGTGRLEVIPMYGKKTT